MTGVQFAAQHLLARALLAARPPRRARPPPLSWRAWARTVAPNGVATGLDIGFSNYSLVFISLSFYVMCKSTTPLFLLGFAIAWGLEKPSWELAAVVGVITAGLLLLVAGETRFDALGFVLVMSAAALAGLRWTITQVLLQGGGGAGSAASPGGAPRDAAAATGHGHGGGGGAHGHGHGGGGSARSAVEVIYQLTPIMSATLLLISLLFERLWVVLPPSPYFSTPLHCTVTAAVMAFGGVIAFSMVWAEYALIGRTSALTFMVVGTFKEIVTVGAAVLVLHEPFTVVNAIGLLVLVAGVAGFNWMKWRRIAAGELRAAPSEDAELELGGGGGGGMKSPFGATAAGGGAGWPARGAPATRAAGVELLARGGSAPPSPKGSPAVTEATWRGGVGAAAASPGHEVERPGSASGRPYKD
jgi:solute carrier family 35 protein C2